MSARRKTNVVAKLLENSAAPCCRKKAPRMTQSTHDHSERLTSRWAGCVHQELLQKERVAVRYLFYSTPRANSLSFGPAVYTIGSAIASMCISSSPRYMKHGLIWFYMAICFFQWIIAIEARRQASLALSCRTRVGEKCHIRHQRATPQQCH